MAKVRFSLDEHTEAGRRGLALLVVREQIGAAIRDGMPGDIIETLRHRERVLSNEVVAALVRSGGLLDAVIGRVQCINTNPGGSDATVSALR